MSQNNRIAMSSGLAETDPESVGFSGSRLIRIDDSMKRHVEDRSLPGMVTVVSRHGNLVHTGAYGMMDIEAGKPMTEDTIFRMASMTKPVVCAGLMMLYEEGRFFLDQPVSDFIPAYKNMFVKGKHDFLEPAYREITVRDCLSHMAGFSTDGFEKIRSRFEPGEPDPLVPGTKKTVNEYAIGGTLREAVELMAGIPLVFHPGTDWEYNPGHAVVGALIEIISGQSLDTFLKERIINPLKMADTCFYLPEEKANRLAAAYTIDDNEWGKLGLIDSPATSARIYGPKTYFSACGGLLSTVSDYTRFARMLLNGGTLDGTTIVGRKTLELMTANHTGNFNIYPMGPGYGYGLGFTVRTSLADAQMPGSIGMFGWDGAYSTTFFVDPKEDLFGILLTQVKDNGILAMIRRDFTRLVYQALV